ncbi:MAG: thiopurine S-methyltransferase [Gallionellaceae bacterium]|nr:thiopurine S-methyltransferase [Gallionellaceae bacterium]
MQDCLEPALAIAPVPVSGEDNALWLQCWRDRATGFHQAAPNPLLLRFWPGLGLAAGSRIFVPLCGKSLDMLWLAGQGYEVIGVELSPIAVRAFFKEHQLQPVRSQVGPFTLWRAGRIGILCGDYFALTGAEFGWIDAVYDRAALTALPEAMRRRYVAHLKAILPVASKVFLLTTEVPEADLTPVRMLAADAEIVTLYAEAFEIELAHVEQAFEADPADRDGLPEPVVRKVYRLTPKSA